MNFCLSLSDMIIKWLFLGFGQLVRQKQDVWRHQLWALGTYDGCFSLFSRLSADQLILKIIVAANQLFLYKRKNNFQRESPSQFATINTKPSFGFPFIGSFHCAKVALSCRCTSLCFTLFAVNQMPPTQKEPESLPEYGVNIWMSLFAGTEVNFELGLTQKW